VLFYYQLQYFSFWIFRKFKKANDDFSFSKWWPSAILDFYGSDFFLTRMVRWAKTHQHTKF